MNSKIAVLTAAISSLLGCSADKEAIKGEEIAPLADGAYLLSSVTITENGETTVKYREQIKIYSKGKFMFAFDNETTGDMDVGAGNATWSNGVMTEEPLVNHDGPLSGLSFDITIEQTENGFEQKLYGMTYDDGRVLDLMVEVWDRAPGEATPFDGLWQLESRDTENPELTQFAETKMIGGGHFAILQSAIYQGEKIRNFGFGTLQSQQNGNVLETGMVGSWDEYQGFATEVKMELIDNNRLQQSFTYNGRLITQTYIKM